MVNIFSKIFELIKKLDGKTLDYDRFKSLNEFIERKLSRYNIFEVVDEINSPIEKFFEEFLVDFILNGEYNLYEIHDENKKCRIIAAENDRDRKIIILCIKDRDIELKIFSEKLLKAYLEN